MEPKTEHERQSITYDQVKDCEVNNQHLIKGSKNILLYQKELCLKLLEYEEEVDKRHRIEERIKEIDSFISQIDDMYNYNKKD